MLLIYIIYGLMNNKSALVQVMDKRPTADKPLTEPMLTKMSVA